MTAKAISRHVPRLLKTASEWVPDRWLRIHVQGSENIPEAGPVLIAARHYHHLYDGLALLRAVPRPVHLLVALDWLEGRTTRHLMMKLTSLARWPVVMRKRTQSGTLSVREMERVISRGVREAVELLTDGSAVAMFPEGYPNIDPHFTPKRTPEEFLPFQYGFARIAAVASRRMRQPVPIVPTGLFFQKHGAREVIVRFGQPLFEGGPETRSAFVQRVEEEVSRLSR